MKVLVLSKNAWWLGVGAVFMVTLLLTASGCASMSNRTKTILTMAMAGVVGGTVGALTAPPDESIVGHAALWGGSAAAVLGVASLFVFDEHAKSKELERQNTSLKKEIDTYRSQGGAGGTEEIVFESGAQFGKEIPDSFRALVKPGKWRIWKLDKWVNGGENRLIHQDKMVEIVPPMLTPFGGSVGTQ